jgi:hypothetical protein
MKAHALRVLSIQPTTFGLAMARPISSYEAIMIKEGEIQLFLCARLQRLGFASGHRARLYGEEFAFTSDPTPEGKGFTITGISQKSGGLRNVHIPLSIVRTIEHELRALKQLKNVA